MDAVEKLFHMKEGAGPTSYAKNSSMQKKASDMVKHITLQTLQQLYLEMNADTICIADLGCSSGSNSLATIKGFVRTVEGTCRKILRPPPEFHVYLNDLPTNDFKSVFMALPDFYSELKKERSDDECPSIYIGAFPGSFYGRLFPSNSLHFIHSSLSVHWLSKVPPGLYDEQGESVNKGSVYISKSSIPVVSHAYLKQFQDDFSLFLRSRSKELIVRGRMVLIMLGRVGQEHVDRGNSLLWELLSRSLASLVSQGEIKEEKLDSYNAHFYAPSKDEIEKEVKREGSFAVDQLEMFEVKSADYGESYGSVAARTVRAIQESMIRHHFGLGEESLNTLFKNYGRMVDEEMVKGEIKPLTFIIILRKL